jgi:hypothetical protein
MRQSTLPVQDSAAGWLIIVKTFDTKQRLVLDSNTFLAFLFCIFQILKNHMLLPVDDAGSGYCHKQGCVIIWTMICQISCCFQKQKHGWTPLTRKQGNHHNF